MKLFDFSDGFCCCHFDCRSPEMTKTPSHSEPLTTPTDNAHNQCRLEVARPELADPPAWPEPLIMLIDDFVDLCIQEAVAEC